MANIPSNAAYMNDLEISADAPITEDLFDKIGANINYLLDLAALGMTSFTANGTYITGENVERIHLLMCGGGGGGGGGGLGGLTTNQSGAGGGAGGTIFEGMIDVTDNTSYPIGVGNGGAGAATWNLNGAAGGGTTFGSLVYMVGGPGGIKGNFSGVASPLVTGGAGGVAYHGTQNGGTGQNANTTISRGAGGGDYLTVGYSGPANGGNGGDPNVTGGLGGGGGGSVGAGGIGGSTLTPASGTLGGGGGGSAGGSGAFGSGIAGNGGDGIVKVYLL